MMVAVGVGVLAVGMTGTASASNFSYATGYVGCQGVNMTDNGNVYWWDSALTTATSTALNATRNSDYNPTDVNTYAEDVLTSQTDVISYDADYEGSTCGQTWISTAGGAGMLGLYQCFIVVSSNAKCDQAHLDFDNDFMGPRTASEEEALACHEFGHAMGLLHISPSVTNSCMLSPFANQPQLSGHDIAHLKRQLLSSEDLDMRRTPVLLGAALLAGALGITAAITATAALRENQPDRAADHAALMKNMDLGSRGEVITRGFDHLTEMLPNATHSTDDGEQWVASDSVVVGTITDVTKRTGVFDTRPAPGSSKFTNTTVPFDSSSAQWRSLTVTVTVSEVLAGPAVSTVKLDWAVMGSTAHGEDADVIGRALKGLGTVLVATRAAATNTTGQTRELSGYGAGLAQVATDGALNFPFLDDGRPSTVAQDTFTDGVDTVAKVRDAARKPTWQAPASHSIS